MRLYKVLFVTAHATLLQYVLLQWGCFQQMEDCVWRWPVVTVSSHPHPLPVWCVDTHEHRVCSIMQQVFMKLIDSSTLGEKRPELRIDSHHYWSQSLRCIHSHRPVERSEKLCLPPLCQEDLATHATIDLWILWIFQFFPAHFFFLSFIL